MFIRATPYAALDRFSGRRLRTFLYLCDWRAVLEIGAPLTGLQWRRCYGSICADCQNLNLDWKRLSQSQHEIVKFVLDYIATHTDDETNFLVQCTYPILTANDDEPLDLITCAKRYQDYLKEQPNTKLG